MKALLSRVSGGPAALVLEDMPDPVPAPHQVVVAVKAVGVNFPDSLIIQDLYQIRPERPFAPGGELAGVVRSVGSKVTRFAVGHRVIGLPGWGGMAEQVAVDEDKCCPMPATMPFDEASAFLATYGTSHHALQRRARLQRGETLLVLGAAGGVGVAAIELGKAMGATVIAAASTQAKVDYGLSCGADGGVVYPSGPFDKAQQRELTDALKSACRGGADVVYDPVGGDYAEPALRTLNWEGRYLVVGFTAGIPRPPLNLVLLKSSAVMGVFWGAWVARSPAGFQAQIRELIAWYEAGRIKPRISARFPLERAPEAIRIVSERRAVGKFVVTM
ncbi:MAG: NADPH:quinone oxidoreductase family protein [Steroidobacteraceae bacterium]